MKTINKVTAFVTRQTAQGLDLLLFKHPYAGIQIPAGTVEPGETPEDAVIREVNEETGLTAVRLAAHLGTQEEEITADQRVIIPPATVYARPDVTSFDWVRIRSAVQVSVVRQQGEFSQITYIENDREPNSNYISMQITGWALNEQLAARRRRDFYHLEFAGQSPQSWTVFSDHHTFSPFWAPMDDLPAIISPQNQWLKYLKKI